MDIQLRKKDSLRAKSGQGLEDVFVDLKLISNSSDYNYNECISATFYDMHQVFIIKKDRTFKVFSFRKNDKVIKSDFGFWEDGEIVFTNSKFIDEPNQGA